MQFYECDSIQSFTANLTIPDGTTIENHGSTVWETRIQ